MRTEDTVACLAGSEFGMLLPGVSGPSQASTTLTQVTDAFAAPFQVDGHELFLTLSVGIAIYPHDGAGAQDLLERAEVAARRVSSEGGNAWEFFRRGMNDEHVGRLALEGELHRALQREQFLVHYQPVVDAQSGAIVGAEALLRWQRPRHGLAMPDEFMGALEETGLSVPCGSLGDRRRVRQAQAWNTAFRASPPGIAVNLSPRQFYDESLLDVVSAALAQSGLPAELLSLEITETTALRDPVEAARILTAVRALGVESPWTTSGPDYSSLSHLVRLPVTIVKIDRSFVRDLLSVPRARGGRHVGDRPRPPSGSHGRGRGRRDRRAARLPARGSLRRPSGVRVQQARTRGRVHGPARRRPHRRAAGLTLTGGGMSWKSSRSSVSLLSRQSRSASVWASASEATRLMPGGVHPNGGARQPPRPRTPARGSHAHG